MTSVAPRLVCTPAPDDLIGQCVRDHAIGIGVEMDPADQMVPFLVEQSDNVDEWQLLVVCPMLKIAHKPSVNQKVELVS